VSAIEVRLYAPGSNTPLLLGSITDPREHGIEGILGAETRTLDVHRFPRAETVKVFDRQNRAEALSIRVSRLHKDLADAFLYWLKHPRNVPIVADIEFTQDNAKAWLNGCGIQTVRRAQRNGITTIFEYQIVGGAWGTARQLES